jgi:hypothetical protein
MPLSTDKSHVKISKSLQLKRYVFLKNQDAINSIYSFIHFIASSSSGSLAHGF